jgi:hypothetical protein
MRLLVVDAYEINGHVRYAAPWEKKSSPPWVARHGMTGSGYQAGFNSFTQQGYRSVEVSG